MSTIEVRGFMAKREVAVGDLGMGAYFFYNECLYIKLHNLRKNNACVLTGDWSGTIEAIPLDAIATVHDRVQILIQRGGGER